MIWFHDFCKENNLTYFMLGGTVLGAIRHKGFIPWDDDADFGMPRNDYERFLNLIEKINDPVVLVESYKNNNADFPYPFAKIYNKTTTLIENLRYPVKRGVYIDVFPLDDCFSLHCFATKKMFFSINLYNLKICNKRKKRGFVKNVMINIFQFLFFKKPNFFKNCKRLNKQAIKQNKKNSKFYANFFGAWQEKEIVPLSVFGTPTLYKFENNLFYGPQDFDKYLKTLYGDYLVLPPVTERLNHHDFLEIDLEKSFIR